LEKKKKSLEGKKKKKNIHENGREYVGIIKTPYWKLMLDRPILKIEERHA